MGEDQHRLFGAFDICLGLRYLLNSGYEGVAGG